MCRVFEPCVVFVCAYQLARIWPVFVSKLLSGSCPGVWIRILPRSLSFQYVYSNLRTEILPS
ncbi:hypothetical protein M6B38_122540 [Iris pallida]|uniref:Uncharacterized protein n=1 Tax=Iris pallida TaxID=29817 RepID=A0AAX6H3U8_IRIPA|nr:hypothetical protein M6B38_122540 [Iris pallida]